MNFHGHPYCHFERKHSEGLTRSSEVEEAEEPRNYFGLEAVAVAGQTKAAVGSGRGQRSQVMVQQKCWPVVEYASSY